MVAVVGSLNQDLVVTTARFPRTGETVPGTDLRSVPGGKGANQAVALARLGVPVGMVGAVGDDPFGQGLRDGLASEGVDVRGITQFHGQGSGVALITLDATAENQIVVVAGANGALTGHDVRSGLDQFQGVSAVVTQYEIPPDAVLAAIRWAGEHRLPLFVNPAPWRPPGPDNLPEGAWIVLNRIEASHLTRQSIHDPASAGRAVAAWRATTGNRSGIVVTLGGEGAWVDGPGGSGWVPAFPVDRPVDTVGAGDAFLAGFVAGCREGRPPDRAARFASAVAALSIGRPGAQSAMPTRAEVDDFLARSGTG